MVVEMNCIVTGYLYCRDIAKQSLTTFLRIPHQESKFSRVHWLPVRLREKVN